MSQILFVRRLFIADNDSGFQFVPLIFVVFHDAHLGFQLSSSAKLAVFNLSNTKRLSSCRSSVCARGKIFVCTRPSLHFNNFRKVSVITELQIPTKL
jgi:hypothetical protein